MKVFVSRPIFDETMELLRKEVEVRANPEERILSKEEMLDGLKDVDGAITMTTDPIDRSMMESSPRIKIIANFGVGFNNVDIPAATELGIAVTNTPGVLTETTADFAWTLLMAAARRIVEADRYTRAGKFKAWGARMYLGHDVFGKTLGIVGLGRIGQAVARRAAGFGMRVIFVSNDVPPAVAQQLGAERVTLDELLRTSDFITLHVPLLAETRHMLNDRTFALMKPNCIVVNTSRGPVVDEAALVRALKSRAIAGAAIDVFEREPEIDPGLFELDNVVLAPHIASASHETRLQISTMAAGNLLAVLKGRRPPNLLNPEMWNRRRFLEQS